MASETQWVNGDISFGPFRLSKLEERLECNGNPVHIGALAFQILTHLVEHSGEVVSKQALMDVAWPNLSVDERNLFFHIHILRKALGDDGDRYILSVPRKGYCFVGPITRHDDSQSNSRLTIFPIGPPRAIPRSLPLIGRALSIEEIVVLLSSHRVVSVTGPGGMGKTSVAITVSQQLESKFRDGACFVELGPVEDPSRVAEAFAIALGLPVKKAQPLGDILQFVQLKEMLILVDGCEHVIDESAALIQAIVSSSVGVRILSTSREALRIEGEWVFQLPPLTSAPIGKELSASAIASYPAIQLFIERAEMATNVTLSDRDIKLLVPISNKLDGLPLAIELAASQVSAIGLEKLVDALGEPAVLEWARKEIVPPGHQTLSAMLDWSCQRLSELEHCMLRHLSLFRGSFEFEAAIVMMQGTMDGSEAAIVLSQLAAKSLLHVDRTDVVVRYRLLDTTKAYARFKLMESGDYADACRKHARLYASALARFQDPNSDRLLQKAFAGQIEDITAAISWGFQSDGDISLAVDLVVGSLPVWQSLHLLQDRKVYIEKALLHLDQVNVSVDVELTLRCSLAFTIMLISGFTEEFTVAWWRVYDVAEAAQRVDMQMVALLRLWSQQVLLSDAHKADDFSNKFQRLAQTSEGALWTGIADWYRGYLRYQAGDFLGARTFLERAASESRQSSIDIQRKVYGYDCRVSAMSHLSNTILLLGDVGRATEVAKQAVELGLSEADDVSVCSALSVATHNLILIGSIEEAESLAREFLKQAEERALGNFYSLAHAYTGLLKLWKGDGGGLKQVDDSLVHMTNLGYPAWVRAFTAERLHVLIEGDLVRTIGVGTTALSTSEPNLWGWYLAEAIRLNGRLAQISGDTLEAERLFLAALEVARSQSSPFWELRAANDLVQLWSYDKRIHGGRVLLEDICSKFSSDMPTKDLIRAKCLLRSL
ncbi:winged helix-turn-helix domain-containing protein [Dyella humi]|uniref:Winged helix-turn-helix domain-containing protein n=2 Tax=Dyella humi TaxID=1770547 RepID=A0ABW8IFH9_9GAMM